LLAYVYNVIRENFDDTKGVIRIRKSKDRKQNGQKKKDKKWINNNLQNITHKTKDRVTQTQLTTGGELRSSRKVSSSCSTSVTHRVILVIYLSRGVVEMSLTGLPPPYLCACPKSGPGFPTQYVKVFLCSLV
jgi:hypothetical protein